MNQTFFCLSACPILDLHMKQPTMAIIILQALVWLRDLPLRHTNSLELVSFAR